MRRAGNLWERFLEGGNLRLAFWKAARGKRGRREVQEFAAGIDAWVEHVRDALPIGDFPLGQFHRFTVRDPKERVIHAAAFPERVLHHAAMNVCEDAFERVSIFDSYACRKGKGQYAALNRAVEFARRFPFYLKMDIRKYFDSIPHDRLEAMLERLFKDRLMLAFFRRVVRSHESSPGLGLPIGSLTSQHFANFYLGALDRHVKETLRCRGYLRYMDDFVVWGESSAELSAVRRDLESFLSRELALEVKPGTSLNRCRLGMDFLGYRVFPGYLRLNRRSRRRFVRKLGEYEKMHAAGEWSERELHDHVLPLLAFVRRAAARDFRRRVLEGAGSTAEGREPGEPGWLVEQRRAERALLLPERQRAGQPEQQPGLPACPSSGRGWMAPTV